jgi:nucleotide-binding universal stress UspA family protein
MKQILVAIDFSKCSIHALEYAISLANRVKAITIQKYDLFLCADASSK